MASGITWLGCIALVVKVRIFKPLCLAITLLSLTGVAILISDKVDFKIKAMKRDKKGHYIIIKGSIQEEDTIINIYAPNIGAPQFARQILTSVKGEINSNTIIGGDFNTHSHPWIDQPNRKLARKHKL